MTPICVLLALVYSPHSSPDSYGDPLTLKFVDGSMGRLAIHYSHLTLPLILCQINHYLSLYSSLTKGCNYQSLANIPVLGNYSSEVCTCIQSPLYWGWSLLSGTISVQCYGNFIIIHSLFVVLTYQRWPKLNIIIVEPLY